MFYPAPTADRAFYPMLAAQVSSANNPHMAAITPVGCHESEIVRHYRLQLANHANVAAIAKTMMIPVHSAAIATHQSGE